MPTLPTVAIAGASGRLGAAIAGACLELLHQGRFTDVIVLSRSTPPESQALASKGATLRRYSEESLVEALKGVDVLVNAIGSAGDAFREKLFCVLAETSVWLYFPSEFGVNHYIHDFSHGEWEAKKRNFLLATRLNPDMRVCRVYADLFLEDYIGPWFGFCTNKDKYEAVGSPTQPSSYTSMRDVSKAVAILASSSPAAVPPELCLSGDSKSISEIAEIMHEHGAGFVDVTSIPLHFKAQILHDLPPSPVAYLRFLMGEGKIDHSSSGLGNHNHIVEGAGKIEAFRSMADLAKETQGRPWANMDLDPEA